MSETIREDIHARLVEIADAIGGINAFRNNTSMSESDLPAINVFDGQDEVDDAALARNVPALAAMPVHLVPIVNIIVAEKTADLPAVLDGYFRAFVKAVLSDSELATIVSGAQGARASGGIRYLGCSPGVQDGRVQVGTLVPRIRFTFMFDPSAL